MLAQRILLDCVCRYQYHIYSCSRNTQNEANDFL